MVESEVRYKGHTLNFQRESFPGDRREEIRMLVEGEVVATESIPIYGHPLVMPPRRRKDHRARLKQKMADEYLAEPS